MYGVKLEELVGKKVIAIYMNQEYLKFKTDGGNFVYGVDADCCSSSVFYDFYGVKNLLDNGKIIETKEVELEPVNIKPENDSTQCYGFQITTESKEFGAVTSVFSFRNYSNGYYGGSLTTEDPAREVTPEITDDVIEIKD